MTGVAGFLDKHSFKCNLEPSILRIAQSEIEVLLSTSFVIFSMKYMYNDTFLSLGVFVRTTSRELTHEYQN